MSASLRGISEYLVGIWGERSSRGGCEVVEGVVTGVEVGSGGWGCVFNPVQVMIVIATIVRSINSM